jgi:hypothetical protein
MFKIYCIAFISFFIAISLFAADQSRSKIKRYVHQVVLGHEYGDTRKVVSRWVIAPTASIYGADNEQKEIVYEVFRSINSCLKPSLGEIHLLPDNTSAANIKIFFAPQRDFKKIAREYNFKYVADRWGYCWMFWDAKNRLTSSIVLLATDKLSGNMLRHIAFEAIFEAFGLAMDTDEFPESIFYERGRSGEYAIAPSELDLKLLCFFYQHIKPGDTRKEVSEKFEMFWPNDKSQ